MNDQKQDEICKIIDKIETTLKKLPDFSWEAELEILHERIDEMNDKLELILKKLEVK